MIKISRKEYAAMYGPTKGDAVRLGDTSLLAEVEHDYAVPGDECLHGGGKTLRDGLGLTPGYDSAAGSLDMLVSNALIIDPVLGVVKADIGIKDGRVSAIGKAGNPDVQPDVDIVVGAATEVIAGEGSIVTAGGIDAHIHFICPQQIEEAMMSGVTTMLGGGTGPATGTNATTCTPGPWHIARMLQAAEAFPMNLGFLGKGNASLRLPLREQVAAVPAVPNPPLLGAMRRADRAGGLCRAGRRCEEFPDRKVDRGPGAARQGDGRGRREKGL